MKQAQTDMSLRPTPRANSYRVLEPTHTVWLAGDRPSMRLSIERLLGAGDGLASWTVQRPQTARSACG